MTVVFEKVSDSCDKFFKWFDLQKYQSGKDTAAAPVGDEESEDSAAAKDSVLTITQLQQSGREVFAFMLHKILVVTSLPVCTGNSFSVPAVSLLM